MSKSTWTYRLPKPLKMKPVVFPLKPVPSAGADVHNKWTASQMENYEHIQQAHTVVMKSPHDVTQNRNRKLEKIRAEVQAGRPLWALDCLQEMYEEELTPLPDHYRAVLNGAVLWDEPDTALDCWRLMERQGLIPDDKTLCCWFETCAAFKFREEALKAWNKYCTEFAFLEAGEADPKPVVRERHSLTRDDLYNLPWWQKRWSYDPNVDVADNHRFNRTREVFASAAAALEACGEPALRDNLFSVLQQKLLETPTPVAEPLKDPNIPGARELNTGEQGVEHLQKKPTRFRIPNIYLFTLRRNTRGPDWVPNHEWLMEDHQLGKELPKSSRDTEHGDPRFYSNVQFLLYAYEKSVRSSRTITSLEGLRDCAADVDRALDTFYSSENPEAQTFPRGSLNFEDFVLSLLSLAAGPSISAAPAEVHSLMHELCEKYAVRPTPAMYQSVYKAFANAPGDAEAQDALVGYIRELAQTRQEMDLQTHTAALEALVATGSLRGHEYFVKNIIRKFRWGNHHATLLLKEYRAIGEAGDRQKQKLLCERVNIWCGRYNVGLSEVNKQFIEDDYQHIGVQVRTKEELITWKMRRQSDLRNNLTPHLPNPVADRVTHTLRESDHIDPNHVKEWFVPYSNAGRSFKWNFSNPHAPEAASDVRDLTDVNRVRYLPQQGIHTPWVNRSRYTAKPGYRPEQTHQRLNVNRWLEETNQSFPGA
eukprot:TRINITY_DN23235_c0_g1_i1.p2 TRINITY_DN23235_c0_g1~~TRINITY_DN23235_c0_g1_i1.p2  ORF type:complete len:706 (+),score=256.08 TRINITY_DN23235_c0_g1_i1:96-2213(+)